MSTSDERLHTESNIWLATVRANGKPHLTPIGFVYVEQAVWVCTGLGAVKSKTCNTTIACPLPYKMAMPQ